MMINFPYYCPKNHITVIKCLADVIFPKEVPCQHEGCDELSIININIVINREASHEWYQPTKEEWDELEKTVSYDIILMMKQHFAAGGMLLREI